MLGHNNGQKLRLSIARNLDYTFTMFCLDLLWEASVARITAVVAFWRVLFIAKMGIHLPLKHLLKHLGVQRFQKLTYVLFCFKLA